MAFKTRDSIILEICDWMKIGCLLDTTDGLPDLEIGVTELILNIEGKIPSSSDLIKRSQS